MFILHKIQYLFGKVDLPWAQDALKDSAGDSVIRFDWGLKQVLEAMTHGYTMRMQSFICASGGVLGAIHVQQQTRKATEHTSGILGSLNKVCKVEWKTLLLFPALDSMAQLTVSINDCHNHF